MNGTDQALDHAAAKITAAHPELSEGRVAMLAFTALLLTFALREPDAEIDTDLLSLLGDDFSGDLRAVIRQALANTSPTETQQ